MIKHIIKLFKSHNKKELDIQDDIGIVNRLVRPIQRGLRNRKNISSQKQYEKIRKNL